MNARHENGSISSRREFLEHACAAAAMAGLAGSARAARPAPPNIILILADDLGQADLGCYGQQKIQTPNLDRLASEGTRFTQCYAGSSVCAPSRCCLMTGMHNGHGRVRDNLPHDIWLQPDDRTVAEVLKQAGYHTGAVGKWSLGNPGSWGVANYQGFDYFFGHLDQDQAHYYYPDYLWEDDEIFELRGNRGGKRETYTGDLFTEKAQAFVRQNQQKPFFLYLAYTAPHWSDYDKNTPESLLVPSDAPYTGKDWPQVEKNYAALVTRLDRDVGSMMDLLKELGIDSNTLVLFTSDNGPSAEALHSVDFFNSNGPLRGVKRELYEGSLRVPMLARWPGHVPADRVSEVPWAFWDVLPTLAELAGLPVPEDIDGISMAPLLLGGAQTQRHEYFYWDYGHVRDIFAQAVRAGDWKGVRNGLNANMELYDIKTDPSEATDVAAAHPDVVAKLLELMATAYVPSKDYPLKSAAG